MKSKQEVSKDALSIQFTMASYCRHLDHKQWELWRTVMSGDASFAFEDVDGNNLIFFRNPSELIQVCIDQLQDAVTIHHLHNFEIITLDDDRAEAIWAMEDRLYYPVDENNERNYMHGYGNYHVSFVREQDEWLISKLRLSRLKLTNEKLK